MKEFRILIFDRLNIPLSGTFSDDIDDQGVFSTSNINTSNNYGYDEEGRLIRDDAEDIAQIKWTLTSKVKEVIRTNGSPKKNLKFDYDASGKRIAKHVYTSANVWESSTYYSYDATGNVMCIYEKKNDGAGINYHAAERFIYGSSRVGVNKERVELSGTVTVPDTGNYLHHIGKKQYELNNHLGNVLSTVSDRLIAKDWNNDNNVDSYKAEILSATDYTPFGVAMDGRTYNTSLSRHGFNGQEKDNEIYGDGNMTTAEFWQYDARLGRRWEMDPKSEFSIASYACLKNNPILHLDIRGDTVWVYTTILPNGGEYAPGITHTFIVVKTASGAKEYFAYGPKPDENGEINRFGGSQLVRVQYQQDIDAYEGKDDSRIKKVIQIVPPANQTVEQFDQNVIKAAKSFGNNPNIEYDALTTEQTTGNCHTSTSTILSKAGLGPMGMQSLINQTPGIDWGIGQLRPWTSQEQQVAVDQAEEDLQKLIEFEQGGINPK